MSCAAEDHRHAIANNTEECNYWAFYARRWHELVTEATTDSELDFQSRERQRSMCSEMAILHRIAVIDLIAEQAGYKPHK